MKSIRLACVAVTVFTSTAVCARPDMQPGDPAWSAYTRTLERTCPEKHLAQLKPADLRDALEHFKDRQTAPVQTQMSAAEKQACQGSVGGASCDNIGDLHYAKRMAKLSRLAQDVCDQFTRLPQD